MLKLRARREFGRRVQWLLGMFGRHLPGCNGGLELLELRPGDVFCVGRERLLELFGGNLSIISRRVQLCGVCRGNFFEFARSVGVKHLRTLRGRSLLVNIGHLCLRGMRRREFRVKRRGIELCGVRFRSIRRRDGLFDVHSVRGRPVPDDL